MLNVVTGAERRSVSISSFESPHLEFSQFLQTIEVLSVSTHISNSNSHARKRKQSTYLAGASTNS